MAITHISEEEAVKDFSGILLRVSNGEDITIDTDHASVRLVADDVPRGRTVREMIAILDNLPGERGVMDEAFARDVRSFRDRHPESLDGAKWD